MFTQDSRSLKLQLANLSKNAFLPIEVTFHEAISQPFIADIHCLSQQNIDCKSLLGQAATLTLCANLSTPRYVNGVIKTIQRGHIISTNFRRYQLTLVPIFDALQYFQTCQFFTELSAPAIFQSYCKQLGFSAFDQSDLTKAYPNLPYTVQFNESAHHFLSRLLQQAEINYYFTHNETQHTLILLDSLRGFSNSKQVASFNGIENNLSSWQPQIDLISSAKINSSGNYSQFSAGTIFTLSEENISYLITEITHHAADYSYLPEGVTTDKRESQNYHNQFSCIDTANSIYVPAEIIQKPIISNLHIATVAAPKDYSQDSYTDEFGRVRLHFPWDKQQQLSNWVPVSQTLNDTDLGGQFIPRIGQEVLVSYLNGDADTPIIIAAAPNSQHKPAHDLEKNSNLSWIKTQTLNSQNPEKANQILWDDTDGQEKFELTAEKNYLEEILNDVTYLIEKDEVIHVDGNALLQVLNDAIHLEAKSISLQGGGSEIVINADGIRIRGAGTANGRVNFFSLGAGAIKAIARVGDPHQCPKQTGNIAHHGGPIIKGANAITANGQVIAREGDAASCRVGTDSINQGISSMTVQGKPVARLNHTLTHGGVITAGSNNVYVGEKPNVPDIYQLLHIKPNNILVIHICDFNNVSDPINTKPTMQQAIQGISARAIALLNDGTTRPWPLTTVMQGKLFLPGKKPADIHSMQIQFEPGAVFKGQQVNVIAINNQPIAATDCINLQGSDFTKMPNYQDKGNNTCYPMTITVLQPALFFNFRQDNYLHSLTDAEQQIYNTIKQYYAALQAWNDQADCLTADEIQYFKKNGNNATIFIHGFNVPTGNFAKGITWEQELNLFNSTPVFVESNYDATLYIDEDSFSNDCKQAFLNYAPNIKNQLACLVGTDAHRWLVCMEKNLNAAAGMLANDYRKYSRLIFINWQSDPICAYDYMAATCLTQFPAKKTIRIIQQLAKAGIKINIMAHSLGSAVLMNILDQCQTLNIIVDHAFLWQSALPKDVFDPSPRWYFPMPNKKNPRQLDPILPYSYNYANACDAANTITVLFSQDDNVLGPMPDDKAAANGELIKTASQLGKSILAKAVIDGLFMLGIESEQSIKSCFIRHACDWVGLSNNFPSSVANAEKFTLSNQNHLALLAAKIYDPAAGMQYAVIADIIDILDQYFVPLAQIHKKLLSIYHLANLFAMPFSYLLEGTNHCEEYFQRWRKAYKEYQVMRDGQMITKVFEENFPAQMQILKQEYLTAYQFIYQCVADIEQLRQGEMPAWLSEAEQNTNKALSSQASIVGTSLFGKLTNYLLDKSEKQDNAELSETVRKFTDNAFSAFLLAYPDYLFTIILIGLLTPDAVPKTALGWDGYDPKSISSMPKKFNQINQQNLLPDHSGMLFPNQELFQKVYKQKLLGGGQGEQLNYFGLYKPA